MSAGVLAPLIPPSIASVIWGVIAEQSISKRFLSGIVPGLAMAGALVLVVLMLTTYIPAFSLLLLGRA